MTDEQIDALLGDLNQIARDQCHYEYGLPIGFDDEDTTPHAKMRAAVRKAIAKAQPAVLGYVRPGVVAFLQSQRNNPGAAVESRIYPVKPEDETGAVAIALVAEPTQAT